MRVAFMSGKLKLPNMLCEGHIYTYIYIYICGWPSRPVLSAAEGIRPGEIDGYTSLHETEYEEVNTVIWYGDQQSGCDDMCVIWSSWNM
jgi:hypothetical protein